MCKFSAEFVPKSPSSEGTNGSDGHAGDGCGVTVFRKNFSADVFAQGVDLVCCRHVLEHIDTPISFLHEIHSLAHRRKAVVYCEVPSASFTLRFGGIWDILYEHFSYFSPVSLSRLFASSGFRVLRTSTTFGEQYLQLEARPGDSVPAAAQSLSALQELAEEVEQFRRVYESSLLLWRSKLAERLERGDEVVIWGAGTKGTMFLNTLAEAENIRYAVDINPRKTGTFLPGTGQEIVSPESLRRIRPRAVVVLNPLYVDEISRSLAEVGVDAEIMVRQDPSERFGVARMSRFRSRSGPSAGSESS